MTKFSLAETSLPYLASDLEWVIYSPSLLTQKIVPDLAALPQSKKIVESVRQDPSGLLNFLQKMKRQNLGTYFEHLVFYWLDQLDEVEVIATNLQIHDENTTVGEFDILFQYHEVFYHWELAIKFYANQGNGRDESQWVGPMKKDNLKRKLDRLFDHQLSLSTTKSAKQVLAHKGVDQLTSYPFVKGMLFDKSEMGPSNANIPEQISPNCTLSTWVSLHNLKTTDLENCTHFCLLYKPRWISTVHEKDWILIENKQQFFTDLQPLFDANPTPVLVAFGSQAHLGIQENSRVFVMPDNWSN